MGVRGEICIGGAGLARGYLNLPELTNEKFIKDPFSEEAGARLYKTGDLGRWLPDGNIEYLGRVDDQVKIRGYRIELGEIESVLNQNPDIQEAVVLAREDKQGTKRLIGYVVPSGTFDKQAIQNYLSIRLPDYMVPVLWVELASLPLTPNGKTDKKALPDPEITDQTSVYVAPRNETEEALATIWEELLGLEHIGIYDNFFELGGDSILMIQVVSRMRRLGYIMQPKDIFNYQDIAGLANAISRGLDSVVIGEQGILNGSFRLLPIQSWYLEREQADVSHYNQSVLLKIHKGITAEVLQQVLDSLLLQHDALRLVFKKNEGEWVQEYGAGHLELSVEDLQDIGETNLAEKVGACGDKYQRSLSIEDGVLMRMVLMQTPEKEEANRLLIVIHHLAVDGVSWRILLSDLEHLLDGLQNGKQVLLGTKGSSYRQWYSALEQYSQSWRLLSQKAYWQQTLNSYEPLPVDKEYAGEVQLKDMVNYQVRLGAEQTRLLVQEVPKAYHTEINDLLLGALCAVLCEWSGNGQVVIGLEGHGREAISNEIDSSGTVGWFTSLYPVLLKVDTDAGRLVKGAKEELRHIPDKGLGYGVLKYINKAKELQGRDPWDLVFNYLGQLDKAVSSGAWISVAGESMGSGISGDQLSTSRLSLNSHIFGGELVLRWSYSSRHYSQDTISEIAGKYVTHLQDLIGHCQERVESGAVYTPSDYGLGAEITYTELDSFMERTYQGKQVKYQIEGLYRLSGLQQGMLFHSLYDDLGSYIEQFSCDLVGVNVEALVASWSAVISRHSILRSAFYYDSFSVPVQCVFRESELPLEELDYRGMDEATQKAALDAYEASDRARGFDFKSAPLMRLVLIRLGEERYRMLWTFHHILFDGWSMQVLIEEFLRTYELLISGQRPAIVPEDRYEDYIRYLERRDKEAEEQYWRNYLKDISQGTLMPFIRNGSERTKGGEEYGSLLLKLDEATTARIQRYAQSHRLTVNTLMQGVWALLLHKYTGNREVLYGVVVSGRPDELPEVERRVGMYINTVLLKAEFGEDQATVDWLQGLQADQVSSRQYQYTALQDVQRWTGIKGDMFDSLLIFENYPVSKVIRSKSWLLQVEKVEVTEQTNYPLTVTIASSEELMISFGYNTDLLEQAYVEIIRDQFEQVLLQITDRQVALLSDFRMLTAEQEHTILEQFNNTKVDYPKDKSIVELFEEQVKSQPEAMAVVFEDQWLSYGELNGRSNQLARYLQQQGVKAETLVPICVERSLEMVIGILGILKAGGAYVPVDQDYPIERINYMLEDTGAKLLLTSRSCRSKVIENEAVRVVEIDGDWEQIAKEQSSNLQTHISPGHLAYVIYTSGSTGKPKGVMIEHQSTYSFISWCRDEFSSSHFDIAYACTSICFDLSVFELFYPLSIGKPIRIVENGLAIIKYLSEDSFVLLNTVPSVIENLLSEKTDLSRISVINMAGEPIPLRVLEGLDTTNTEVRNLYGPTEDTTYSTIYRLEKEKPILIGKPISNTQIYILSLSENRELSPIGLIGEICIGGAGLARGYLNRPELTNEKFIKDTFSK